MNRLITLPDFNTLNIAIIRHQTGIAILGIPINFNCLGFQPIHQRFYDRGNIQNNLKDVSREPISPGDQR